MHTALLVAILVGFPMIAQAQTCASMRAQCKAECPAAMAANPRVPAGCTCDARAARCVQTKSWPSWDGIRSKPMNG